MRAGPEPAPFPRLLPTLLRGEYAETDIALAVVSGKHMLEKSKSILHVEGQLASQMPTGCHVLRESAGIQLLQPAGLNDSDKESTERRRCEADSR